MIRRSSRIHINTNSLIHFSLAVFAFLYFLPITITLPDIIRKPLLIIGLISFIGALLISESKYLLWYVIASVIALVYYAVSWSVRLSFTSYMFPALVSIEFLVCSLMVLDGRVQLPRKIVWLFYIAILVTAVTSIIGLQQFSMAVRILGQGASDENSSMQYIFRRYNIAGWGLLFGMGFIEGSLIYEYKKNKKWFFLIAIIVDGICILFSQLAFAIILSAMVMLFSIINGKSRDFILRLLPLIVAFIVCWIERRAILAFLYNLTVRNNLVMLQLRIINLSDLLLFGSTFGDTGVRFDLYMRGVDSFFQYPFGLFLVERSNITDILGFHSEFFDLIGSLGIFGFITVVLLFMCLLSRLKKIEGKYNRRFYIIMAGSFSIMFLINPVLYQPHIWLSTLLIPAILIKDRSDIDFIINEENL